MYAEAKETWTQVNQPEPLPKEEHQEGPVARTIEQQTAQLPSDTFLIAALGSMGVSAVLQIVGARQMSIFVGQWAPCFLMFGHYNKIVKLLGSDGTV